MWKKYENFFEPYQIKQTSLETIVSVKVYDGNNATNIPEFEESHQILLPLSDVVNSSSDRIQFKVDCDFSVNELFPNLIELMCSTHEKLSSMIFLANYMTMNVRISGANWRFPEHFDTYDQLILHHFGSKFWKVDGKWIQCDAGDVLYIPAGVLHKTINNSAAMISNIGLHSTQTNELTKLFDVKYPKRTDKIKKKSDTLHTWDEDFSHLTSPSVQCTRVGKLSQKGRT